MRESPIVLDPGAGQTVEVRGSTIWFKGAGADTGGRFSFIERLLRPGGRAPTAHRHPDCHEAFYVLDGRIDFTLDDATTSVDAGGFVLVPPSVFHTFANRSENEARLLILHSPAMDRYFQELHDLLNSGADLPAERALMERYGMELAPVSDTA